MPLVQNQALLELFLLYCNRLFCKRSKFLIEALRLLEKWRMSRIFVERKLCAGHNGCRVSSRFDPNEIIFHTMGHQDRYIKLLELGRAVGTRATASDHGTHLRRNDHIVGEC